MARALRSGVWLACGLLALALLAQPISVGAQAALGLVIIPLLILIWKFGCGPYARQAFLALASFIVVRYLYWRISDTLPPISDPFGYICGRILLAAEIYCSSILAISLIINIDPLRRKPLPHIPDDQLPTVDVFIPTYNEDEYILATTVAAARLMDYPPEKLTVYLLDDGGTDQKCNDKNPEKAAAARERRASLTKLCAELGARYHTRARNEHAKAGNMNAALPHSEGEVIVVFDADHAPFRAFLRETVGYFLQDPKLFLVQTPHVFLNPDPIEKNLRTFKTMPSENEMFYSVTQRGLDKWDGSFFCGSAALLRRAALELTGGFSGVTITEDCETAFELHAKGWHSVYVDKPLIAGLQPETFASFIGQRSRWCQGMFQIMLLKNPVLKRGLKPIQRLAYLSSMTFWFFPFPRLIFMFAPLIYIFLNVKIFVANLQEGVAYTLVYMIVNMMMQNFMFGRVRWPWVSELYEYVQGVFLAQAIVSVIMSPRKPTFNVTAKGLSLENDHLSELAWPFFAIWGALLAGLVMAIWRYAFDPGANMLILVVGLWNAFNLIIAGAALGAIAERREPDRHPRLGINRMGILVVGGEQSLVHVRNVSAGGCAFEFLGEAPSDERLHEASARLYFRPMPGAPKFAPLPCLQLRVSDRRELDGKLEFAAVFNDMTADDYFGLAELMFGDSEALPTFLQSRRKHKNLLVGSMTFIWWGLREPVRAFRYAAQSAKAKAPTPVAEAQPEPSGGGPIEVALQARIDELRRLVEAGERLDRAVALRSEKSGAA
jgi:cellulose synthase (UDP-forming)